MPLNFSPETGELYGMLIISQQSYYLKQKDNFQAHVYRNQKG